jgi:large subunit ribosomal protein L32
VAVPKRKISRTNRDKRRTHDRIKIVNIVECPRCHSKKLAHHVCQSCGYYKNTEIISQEKDAKGKSKEKEEPKADEKKDDSKEKETQKSKK